MFFLLKRKAIECIFYILLIPKQKIFLIVILSRIKVALVDLLYVIKYKEKICLDLKKKEKRETLFFFLRRVNRMLIRVCIICF